MAESFMQPVVDKLFSQVTSLVAEEINLATDVKRQLSKLRKTVNMIRDLLDDAEKRRVSDKAVNSWLKELEDIAYEAEDVLDDVAYEVLRRKVMIQNKLKNKASNFFSRSNPILFRLKIAHRVKDINLRLSDLKNEANSFGLTVQYAVAAAAAAPPPLSRESRETHSYVDVSQVLGRGDEISQVVDLLTATSSNQEALSVISVVGMAGLGKTTFAQCIRHHEKVKMHFEVIMWVCVSDDFDIKRILKEMLECLDKSKCDKANLDAIVEQLRDKVRDRKFLLVLDDVWNDDRAKWNSLKGSLTAINSKVGNHVIVTTRIDQIASIMETSLRFPLGKLTDEICRTIFEQRAFASGGAVRTPELESIGMQIVRKCGGLPLAAAASGGMMWAKKDKEEWLSILHSKIWWDKSEILPAIRLSFDHLPSAATKQCFAYCSIFRKDSIMERDDLIQLWMGQGLLQPPSESTLEMEDVGDQYIQTLLWNNLLQDANWYEWRNWRNNIQSFKMHDVVHDLAQSLSNARCFTVEAGKMNNLSDFRHLNLGYSIETRNNEIQLDSSKLRTLFFNGDANFGSLMNSKSLRCLALCTEGTELDAEGTEELPTFIGKLKHLRYLNLSRIRVKELPYSVTDLFHLQTLRLGDQDLGRGVAKDFKKLVSLRHLYIDKRPMDVQMPRGIGQLPSLQTLPFFTVGRENGQRIEELGSLCNLRGELVIYELQNVRGKEEAKKANLLGKSKILELSLKWSDWVFDNFSNMETKNDEEVLEGLQPHHNLKGLSIERYRGEIIPEWIMMRRGMSTLENLVDICFSFCHRIQEMPTLGRLPCLRKIKMWGMKGIKCIGHEFYDTRGSDGSQTQTTLFPALKELCIRGMNSLVEWLEAELPCGGIVFPVLEELEIWDCPQLRTIPTLGRLSCLRKIEISGIDGIECIGHEFYDSRGSDGSQTQTTLFPALKKLSIDGMGSLVEWLEAELPWGGTVFPVLEELKIRDCPQLRTIPREFPYLKSLSIINIGSTSEQSLVKMDSKLNSLTYLHLSKLGPCLDLEELLENNSQSLSLIRISECQQLTRLPDALESLRSLEVLEIVNCCNLTCFPKNITGLTSLRRLDIGGFWGELDSFPFLNNNAEDIRQLVSLRSLCLRGWPKLKTLPHPIQHLPALANLLISKCDGIVELPDWLCNLSSLQQLHLLDCESLKFLPHAAAMKRLSNLKYLLIRNCPHLKEACSDESDPEWSKIAHIEDVIFF